MCFDGWHCPLRRFLTAVVCTVLECNIYNRSRAIASCKAANRQQTWVGGHEDWSAKGAEEPLESRRWVGWCLGRGVHSTADLGVWESIVSSPSGVSSTAPTENDTFFCLSEVFLTQKYIFLPSIMCKIDIFVRKWCREKYGRQKCGVPERNLALCCRSAKTGRGALTFHLGGMAPWLRPWTEVQLQQWEKW